MLNLQALFRAQEEDMVHPVQGTDPNKAKHRTYKTLEPAGEIAVVQRPEGTVKILFYTCSGADSTCHTEVLLDRGSLQLCHGDSPASLPHRRRRRISQPTLRGRGRQLTGPTPPPAPDR